MSTFSGKIQEIPHISVDRFDGINLKSEAYFLSHCHSDHMVGLFDYQSNFINNNKYLYTSEISCAILKKQFPMLENNIRVLDISVSTTVLLKGGNISVLPIPAGHCPGSVMFLFETNIRILYTGDYRINKSDIKKLPPFYNTYNQVVDIEKIYLDTTFFLKSYLKFPRRKESLEELCKIIKEWINKGKNYSIKLYPSAKYGYEYLFIEIFKEIGMPIHVNQKNFELYSTIPEMDNSVTTNDSITQIHCNCGSFYNNVCYKALTSEVRTIKISAFRWVQDNLEDGLSSNSYNMYYVCYSTHASYEEGVEFLRFLKPKSVEICVEHENPQTNLEIRELIEEVLRESKPEIESKFEQKLFHLEENNLEGLDVVEEKVASNNFDFRILDSPPRNIEEESKEFQINTDITTISYETEEELNMSDNSLKITRTETDGDDLMVEESKELKRILNSKAYPSKKVKGGKLRLS